MSLATLGSTFASLYAEPPAKARSKAPQGPGIKGKIPIRAKALSTLDTVQIAALRADSGPQTVAIAEGAAGELTSNATQAGAPPEEQDGGAVSDFGKALKDLTTYIPSEILTFYLAATAAIAAAGGSATSRFTLATFIICLILTPLWAYGSVLLGMPAKQGARSRFPNLLQVAWPMISGTIAFTAYAFAVPSGLLSNAAGDARVFGIITVLAVTPLLHLGGQIYVHVFKPPAEQAKS